MKITNILAVIVGLSIGFFVSGFSLHISSNKNLPTGKPLGHCARMIWIANNAPTSQALLAIDILNKSYVDGLNPRDYHIANINNARLLFESASLQNKCQLANKFDAILSANLLHYERDIYYGRINVKSIFPYWKSVKPNIDLYKELQLFSVDPNAANATLTPNYGGYIRLRELLHKYQDLALHGNFTSIPLNKKLKLGDSGKAISLLRARLYITGELKHRGTDHFDQELQNAVTLFQQNNGLYDDGDVGSDTLQALNTPFSKIVSIIELNLDKMRMLPSTMPDGYIMVNVPDYTLIATDGKQNAMHMDVAVGASLHQTCVLNSNIDHLILNPYWDIPASIALDEIWPELKKNPKYLTNKHLQVIRSDHGKSSIVNGSTMKWNQMTPKEFSSFRYRQLPGSDNPLGRVKFIFNNPCQIYLHDSNEKQVFDVYARAFSHGCVRLAQPLNLTTYILHQQKGYSGDMVDSMYTKEENKAIMLNHPVRLFIVYFTAFASDDSLQLRPDIYGIDNQILRKK